MLERKAYMQSGKAESSKVFQLSLGFWGQWGLSNCPLPAWWLQQWSCHVLEECRHFILLLYADSDPQPPSSQRELKQWSDFQSHSWATDHIWSHPAPSVIYLTAYLWIPWITAREFSIWKEWEEHSPSIFMCKTVSHTEIVKEWRDTYKEKACWQDSREKNPPQTWNEVSDI